MAQKIVVIGQKRLTVLGLLFALCACTHVQDHWANDAISGHSPISRLLYKDNVVFPELELEFVQSGEKLFGYLSLFFDTFPKEVDEPNSTNIIFTIDNLIYSKILPRLQGGQKVKLDDDLVFVLINALKANKSIRITSKGISEVISGEGFSKKYQDFINKKSANICISPDSVSLESHF
jgi:hypothetical protein